MSFSSVIIFWEIFLHNWCVYIWPYGENFLDDGSYPQGGYGASYGAAHICDNVLLGIEFVYGADLGNSRDHILLMHQD